MPTSFTFGAQVGVNSTGTTIPALDDLSMTAVIDDGTVNVGDEVAFTGIGATGGLLAIRALSSIKKWRFSLLSWECELWRPHGICVF